MKAEAEQFAEADKKERERVDKLNQADSLIFSTETFLNENGDKIPADQRPAIDSALQQLKDAHSHRQRHQQPQPGHAGRLCPDV